MHKTKFNIQWFKFRLQTLKVYSLQCVLYGFHAIFESLRHSLIISNSNEVDWLVVWPKNLIRYFSMKRPTRLNVMRNTSVTLYYFIEQNVTTINWIQFQLVCHSEVNLKKNVVHFTTVSVFMLQALFHWCGTVSFGKIYISILFQTIEITLFSFFRILEKVVWVCVCVCSAAFFGFITECRWNLLLPIPNPIPNCTQIS